MTLLRDDMNSFESPRRTPTENSSLLAPLPPDVLDDDAAAIAGEGAEAAPPETPGTADGEVVNTHISEMLVTRELPKRL